jgi:hypothetical protein
MWVGQFSQIDSPENVLREELSNRTGDAASPEKIKFCSSNWSIDSRRPVTKYVSATTPSIYLFGSAGVYHILSSCEHILHRDDKDLLMPEDDQVLHVQDIAAE